MFASKFTQQLTVYYICNL